MFVYAHVNSNTHNVQFSHIASTDNNYDISVYSIFWIALLNTASLMLSVTWLAFFQFFFLFNRKCQAFLIASFLFFWALRYHFFCRCWKIKFYSTSRQKKSPSCNVQRSCWNAGTETGGNTKEFLTPCRAQGVHTKKRKKENGRCEPAALLPKPWEAALVLLPLFAGQLLWPLRRALLLKAFSSSTFLFLSELSLKVVNSSCWGKTGGLLPL